jgi:PadR family transcriptional regulator AphA
MPRPLSLTSYLVLGLINQAGEATPYDLKQMATAVSGLLEEDRETHGRRRRRFRMTPAGRNALTTWLGTPTAEFTELRDPGLLQLYLGAEPSSLAAVQLSAHEERLAEYEQLADAFPPDVPQGVRLALESGIGHEREWVRFWRRITNAASPREI